VNTEDDQKIRSPKLDDQFATNPVKIGRFYNELSISEVTVILHQKANLPALIDNAAEEEFELPPLQACAN